MVLAGKQRPRTHPRMTHRGMSTRTQSTGMVCTQQLLTMPRGRKAALGIQKHHTHCWCSQVCSAGSASAVCCFRKRSARNICWIAALSSSGAPCDLKAGIQRACYKHRQRAALSLSTLGWLLLRNCMRKPRRMNYASVKTLSAH